MKFTVASQGVPAPRVPMLSFGKPWSHAATPSVHPMIAVSATLMALALLSGCKDEKTSAAQPENLPARHVREAAEQNIRSSVAASIPIQFRGVQVYAQAMPRRMAVCGQVDPFADNPNLFVPFVALVAMQEGPGDGAPHYTVELVVSQYRIKDI